MIKVKCLGGHSAGGNCWQTLNLRPYIPDDEQKGRSHMIMDGAVIPGESQTKSFFGDAFISPEAILFFRSGFRHDGSKINRCIQHITKGHMAVPWAGPFIAFKHADIFGSHSAVMDEELPVLIQYFRTGMTGPITARKDAKKEARKKGRKAARRAWRK